MFYNQNYNNEYRYGDNHYNNDYRYGDNHCNNDYRCDDNHYNKDNRRPCCCVKYTQEFCSYPSYYNGNEYNRKDDRYDNCWERQNNCCKENNWNNMQCKGDCNRQNKCCFCNRLFRW